ncbi:TadE/TadG family type IV pilus assembly protein [Paenibacillus arenilitoris]|uniref:Pilus assembly protein n=1 Tax=Paenibacillus arenilitoris TaxID=2772299 RepID=A0A927CKB4_9BACL|nr:TadE/TadG family type IV pilus assembly protein [Paenibacillus arenilitoris]MBD2867771.1 pilus assembly protein [Paenibacillus arenilitoris]
MKQAKPSAGPTEDRRRTREQGSIVVEAALVMPLLLIVLLVFVTLVRLCAVQMALHSAASQTVRQIAAHIHPADLAWQQAVAANPLPSMPLPLPGSELSSWGDIAAEAAEWLPSPAGEIAASALRGDFRPLQNAAATEVGRAVVEPLLQDFADKAIVEPERLKLAWLSLPDLEKNEEPFLKLIVEYEFPLKLPFYAKPLVLKEQAAERVWISDAAPARYGAEEGDSAALPIQIVAIEPAPLRPGRKATVVVKTAPGAAVSLGVRYKSGSSKAKHLGEAVADASGYVQWTWHVSGNTTPGIWELAVAEAADPDNRVAKHFIVEKSGGTQK